MNKEQAEKEIAYWQYLIGIHIGNPADMLTIKKISAHKVVQSDGGHHYILRWFADYDRPAQGAGSNGFLVNYCNEKGIKFPHF